MNDPEQAPATDVVEPAAPIAPAAPDASVDTSAERSPPAAGPDPLDAIRAELTALRSEVATLGDSVSGRKERFGKLEGELRAVRAVIDTQSGFNARVNGFASRVIDFVASLPPMPSESDAARRALLSGLGDETKPGAGN